MTPSRPLVGAPWTWALLSLLLVGAGPAAGQSPSMEEVPIAVAKPVRLAYQFQAGRVRKYQIMGMNQPGGVMITARVLRILSRPKQGKPAGAEMRYLIQASAPMGGQQTKGKVTLLVNQRSDGKLWNLRRANGQTLSDSDWPDYGFGLFAAMGSVVGVQYLHRLVLPHDGITAGETWTASVTEVTRTRGTGPTFSLTREARRYKYRLLRFVRWNGHNCAKISRMMMGQPAKSSPEDTFYFDYEHGVLAGFLEHAGPRTNLGWLTAPQPKT